MATIIAYQNGPDYWFKQICETVIPPALPSLSVDLQPTLSRAHYLHTLEQLKHHIHRGDCYEINYCQEFAAEAVRLNPIDVYSRLAQASPNPFGCFYKQAGSYALCASPERFLQKWGSRIISQPIKGTAARQPYNELIDAANKHALLQSAKDKAENVMVADLVRNDLARICVAGTVRPVELFGVYTYPHVYQMISTIEGELRDGVGFTDIVKATFPMGSMTGAPKQRVVELTLQYERGDRGLYSGSVGYIDPKGNFDLNVMIRSIFYHADTGYVGYWVGGGITWLSHAEAEYEECMVKATAMRKILTQA